MAVLGPDSAVPPLALVFPENPIVVSFGVLVAAVILLVFVMVVIGD